MKNLITFERKISNKFPFIFLFFCYWINTYSTLGSKVILYLSTEDNLFEYCSLIFIVLSAIYILKTLFIKNKKYFSLNKKFTLIFIFLFLIIWAIEEVSWGQRIFNLSWDKVSSINFQNELNFHNLSFFQPHLHKSYYILGLIVSYLCILKKTKFSLLPSKSILYFFFLPSLYYLVGEIILNFPIEIRGEIVLQTSRFHFQEVNELLLSLGTLLYSLRLYRIQKKNSH